MERLTLSTTQLTPMVDFDYDNRSLKMRGESYPENAAEFYSPILASLRSYLASAVQRRLATVVELEFVYVNSSSTRSLQQILTLLDTAARDGAVVHVHWIVAEDDDSMTDLGADLLADKHALEYQIVNRR